MRAPSTSTAMSALARTALLLGCIIALPFILASFFAGIKGTR